MKAFFGSNAGKGTAGVLVTCLILVWPLVASWLVAALTLYFAVHHFRESFRLLDAETSAPPATATDLAVPARGEASPCDVDAVMASLAATSASPKPR